ncbi:hypothetical protein C3731_13870 [Brucella oryzae]|uniref:Uncharacterized protein n=2 Tax=Brucella oryzae TaxID=335286 RepID=A0A2S7IYA8_9HYPH|nr:hypothetical protein [Brucella oryzae]PQA72992.1 hypothetical protein C3731_13870 [Brucella oryzae]
MPFAALRSVTTLSFDDVFRKNFQLMEVFEKALKIGVSTVSSMIEHQLFHILFQKDCRKMQMGLVHPKVIC